MGAIYERKQDNFVSANREAEIAVVKLVLAGRVELFDRVEPADFYYRDLRCLFDELVMMHLSGASVADAESREKWFARKEVVQRLERAEMEQFFDCSRPLPAERIFEIALGAAPATEEQLDTYLIELRRWRVLRGVRLLAFELPRMLNQFVVTEVLANLTEMIGRLTDLAAPLNGVEVVPAGTREKWERVQKEVGTLGPRVLVAIHPDNTAEVFKDESVLFRLVCIPDMFGDSAKDELQAWRHMDRELPRRLREMWCDPSLKPSYYRTTCMSKTEWLYYLDRVAGLKEIDEIGASVQRCMEADCAAS